jgi:uncharacterized protein
MRHLGSRRSPGARPRTTATLLAGVLAAGVLVAAAPVTTGSSTAAPTPDDATYSEHYFPAGDGVTMLHADVLRPAHLGPDDRTPVILTVTPYGNHSGSTTELGVGNSGMNPRFFDFLELSDALAQGYTYVMVDLPGFGGSGGCNDWGGAREQDAVRAAVEWAASQSWSTGKVALLGKSYDAWTGLMGIAQQPEGLAAVVSLEPVYAGYRYIYNDGVRRSPTQGTVALFQVIDAKPGTLNDDPMYHVNGAPQVWCYGVNVGLAAADDDPAGPYWAERDLLRFTEGRTTPLFLTQGFLETNTLTDGAFQYFNGLAGDQNRAWYGQFDHCRGWETERACNGRGDDRLAVGRAGFMDEVMRFLDLHLKGIEPTVTDPTIEVQDILGRWRAEASWPPADMRLYETVLATGSYTDTGSGSGVRPSTTAGIWSVSEPLPHDVWFSGEPSLSVRVSGTTPPRANLAANVYDVAPDGSLTMISRGVSLLRGTGTRTHTVEMFGQDWPIPAGHRIAVLLQSGNDGYTHVGTRGTVTIESARIRLPFLTEDRTEFLPSEAAGTPRLERFLGGQRTVLSPEMLTAAERPFTLPGPLR